MNLENRYKLVQLVPANIYKNVFGKKLRELLRPHIKAIREYPGQELFDKTLTSSTIFLFDKTCKSNIVSYIDLTAKQEIEIVRSSLGEKWIFSNTVENLQERVRFGDCFHASIVVATLLNKAFLLSECTLNAAGIEAEVVKKAASPKQMRRKKKEYIIFPYCYMEGKLMRYDEATFEQKFPNATYHLNTYRDELDQRKKDDKAKWFEYGRSQELTHLNQKKLLMSTVVTKQVELYLLDEDTIPYSGIFITVKKARYSLDDAIRVLQSDHFIGENDIPEETEESTENTEMPMTDFEPYKGKIRKPGTGCISQINDRLFEGRYSPMWVDGKKRGFNVYAKTREEVEVKLADLIANVKAEKKRLLAEMAAEKEDEDSKKRKKK